MNTNQENKELTDAKSERRNWAASCHGAAVLGLLVPFGNLIGPVIVWLMKKDEMDEVNREGKSAINFQILTTLVCAVIFLLTFALSEISYAFVSMYWVRYGISFLAVGVSVVKALKVYENKEFQYPIRHQFIK